MHGRCVLNNVTLVGCNFYDKRIVSGGKRKKSKLRKEQLVKSFGGIRNVPGKTEKLGKSTGNGE